MDRGQTMKRLTERIAPGYEFILIEGDGYTRDKVWIY